MCRRQQNTLLLNLITSRTAYQAPHPDARFFQPDRFGRFFREFLFVFHPAMRVPGEVQVNDNLTNPAGVAYHYLSNVQVCTLKGNVHGAGLDSHGGNHTGTQGGDHQIRR